MTAPHTVTTAIRYFTACELDCRGTRVLGAGGKRLEGSGVIKLDSRFAEALPKLREAWGKPLSTNSVCRTPAHNQAVGGHPRSMHLTENPAYPGAFGTLAADIRWRDWRPIDQLAFARLAWRTGWAVGLHDGFCHVDLRRVVGRKPTVFLYGTWTGDFGAVEVRQTAP